VVSQHPIQVKQYEDAVVILLHLRLALQLHVAAVALLPVLLPLPARAACSTTWLLILLVLLLLLLLVCLHSSWRSISSRLQKPGACLGKQVGFELWVLESASSHISLTWCAT
jgi:hypothetical protein